MKNIIAASIVIASTVLAGGAFAAQDTSAQPYIWTNGEAGLITNPAYKSSAAADKTVGILLVGVGENESKVNPKFAKSPDMKFAPLFKAGVGEVSLIEIAPIVAQMVASK
jgi:hypothetical protein